MDALGGFERAAAQIGTLFRLLMFGEALVALLTNETTIDERSRSCRSDSNA